MLNGNTFLTVVDFPHATKTQNVSYKFVYLTGEVYVFSYRAVECSRSFVPKI